MGIPSGVELKVETTMHPEDAEMQRRLLSMAMPTLSDVSVQAVRGNGAVEGPLLELPKTGATTTNSSGNTSSMLASVEYQVLSHCLESQLVTVANAVVKQVEERAGKLIDELTVVQGEQTKTVAEIIVNTMGDELRKLQASSKRQEGVSTTTATTAPNLPDEAVQLIAEAVGTRVMELVQPLSTAAATTPSPSDAPTLASLETAVESHFKGLEDQLLHVVDRRLSSLHPDARTAIAEAVEAASLVQQSSLSNLLEKLMQEHQDAIQLPLPSQASSIDTKALGEFVEGALQTSTEELRRTITGEVQKILKIAGDKPTGKSRKASTPEGDASSSVAAAAAVVEEIEKVFDVSQRVQTQVAAVDEAVSDIYREQAAARATIEKIYIMLKEHLEKEVAVAEATPTVSDATFSSESIAPLQHDIASMKYSVEQLSKDVGQTAALLEIHQDKAHQNLHAVAQVVSDSLNKALQDGARESVQAALATVEEQLRHLQQDIAESRKRLDEVANRQQEAPPAPPPVPVAVEAPPPSPLPMTLSKEDITAAVEAVLLPRWRDILDQTTSVQQAHQTAVEQQLIQVADSISKSVASMMNERWPSRTDEGSENAATAATVTESLQSFERALMGDIQKSLASRPSAEIDLTPLYKYIDSILAFMKEELNAQEAYLTTQLKAMADGITTAIKDIPPPVPPLPSPSAPSALQPPAETKMEEPSSAALAEVVAETKALKEAIEANATVLNHVEQRLTEVSKSTDTADILHQLQNVAATLEASSSLSTSDPAQPTGQLSTIILATEEAVKAQGVQMERAVSEQADKVMSAIHQSASSADLHRELDHLTEHVTAITNAQTSTLHTQFDQLVKSGEVVQATAGQLSETMTTHFEEIHKSLAAQQSTMALLHRPLIEAEMTAEHQQRYRDLQSEGRRIVTAMSAALEKSLSISASKSSIAAAKTAIQEANGCVEQLQQLQRREEQLQRDVEAVAPQRLRDEQRAAVADIIKGEVAALQQTLSVSTRGLTDDQERKMAEISTMVHALTSQLTSAEGALQTMPSENDIKALLDAAVERLSSVQQSSGKERQASMEAAVAKSTEAIQASMHEISGGITASLQDRFLPQYHEAMTSSWRATVDKQAAEVKEALTGAASKASSSLQHLEAVVQRSVDVHQAAAQVAVQERAAILSRVSSLSFNAKTSIWPLLLTPLFAFLAVNLSMYYIFACLLLVFVPKPGAAEDGFVDVDATADLAATAAEPEPDQSIKRRGRYIDQYLIS